MLKEMRTLAGNDPIMEKKIRRPKPTELQWGIYYPRLRNRDEEYEKRVDGISWKADVSNEVKFQVLVYRIDLAELVDDNMEEKDGTLVFKDTCAYSPGFIYFSTNLFGIHLKEQIMETGYYYFTVTTMGDNKEYTDSEAARSGNWLYVRPEEQLPKIDAVWKYPVVQIMNPVVSNPYLKGYAYKILYLSPRENVPRFVAGNEFMQLEADGTLKIADLSGYARSKGGGKLYFKVCAMSSNITLCRNGKWSELSEAYEVL